MVDQSPLAATLAELDAQVIEQSPAALYVCRAPDAEIVRFNTLAVNLWGRTPQPRDRLTGAWRTRFPDGRLMAADESAMAEMVRMSGGELVPVIEVDGKILADFGPEELAAFWEKIEKENGRP